VEALARIYFSITGKSREKWEGKGRSISCFPCRKWGKASPCFTVIPILTTQPLLSNDQGLLDNMTLYIVPAQKVYRTQIRTTI
jgi:hypothetical protein